MQHPEERYAPGELGPIPALAITKQRYALDGPGLAAFAIYLGLAFVFFARGLVGRFSSSYIGQGVDPQMLMWLMAWWPHAILHGLNPLYTGAVWAPHGVNLAWTTCMPLLSLALAPLTLATGPIFAYNVGCLLAVALAGWSAFILCRYVSGSYWASLVGGYVFGFSAYMVGHTAAHLVEILVLPIPLFAWLLMRGFRSDISRRALTINLVLVLATELLLNVEFFATTTLFAVMALAIMLAVGSRAEKKNTLAMLPTVALSYIVTVLLVSPYLYYMLAFGRESGPLHSPALISNDLLSIFIPTPALELGRLATFRAISGHFLGDVYEASGYISLPLMMIVAAFAYEQWRAGWARFLIAFFLSAVVFSLGPLLLIGGRVVTILPGLIFFALPLICKALPARMIVYGFLAAAVIIALWLSSDRVSLRLRVMAAFAVLAMMLPNLSARFWTSAVEVPSFFSAGLYAKYLARNETIVALPYGSDSKSMLWQFESDWYFRMAGGYVGPLPRKALHWPVVSAFNRGGNVALPDAGDQLKAFLATHHARAILIDDSEAEIWRPLMTTLGVKPTRAGGITLYRVPPAELEPWVNATAFEMEKRAGRARFAALVLGAQTLLRTGSGYASLSPVAALRARRVPGWVVVPGKVQPPYAEGGVNFPERVHNPHVFAGMWLSADERGLIKIGVKGRYPVLRSILEEYRHYAINFTPYELALPSDGVMDNRRGMLMMTFGRQGLKRAASHAENLPMGRGQLSRRWPVPRLSAREGRAARVAALQTESWELRRGDGAANGQSQGRGA